MAWNCILNLAYFWINIKKYNITYDDKFSDTIDVKIIFYIWY